MPGLNEPKGLSTQLPLWNTAVFQKETGATYQCPALIRKGVLRIGDLLKEGGLDEAKLAPVAATWWNHYRTEVRNLMTHSHSPQEGPQRAGPVLPELDTWKLSRVSAALAGARAPEGRQPETVWKALREAGLPRKVHSVVHSILWKKLPLADRMHRMQMADTDLCPLCQRKEDHEHRVKKCPYLDQPIQVIRDLYRPIKKAAVGGMEPSRLCPDYPELSLQWEQGIFMWSAVAALWRYRCEVRKRLRQNRAHEGGICGVLDVTARSLGSRGDGDDQPKVGTASHTGDPPLVRVQNKANAGGGPRPPAQKGQEGRPAGAQG